MGDLLEMINRTSAGVQMQVTAITREFGERMKACTNYETAVKALYNLACDRICKDVRQFNLRILRWSEMLCKRYREKDIAELDEKLSYLNDALEHMMSLTIQGTNQQERVRVGPMGQHTNQTEAVPTAPMGQHTNQTEAVPTAPMGQHSNQTEAVPTAPMGQHHHGTNQTQDTPPSSSQVGPLFGCPNNLEECLLAITAFYTKVEARQMKLENEFLYSMRGIDGERHNITEFCTNRVHSIAGVFENFRESIEQAAACQYEEVCHYLADEVKQHIGDLNIRFHQRLGTDANAILSTMEQFSEMGTNLGQQTN